MPHTNRLLGWLGVTFELEPRLGLLTRSIAAEHPSKQEDEVRVALAVIAALMVSAFCVASAGADVACGNAGGTICCGNQTWLPIRNVAVSYWYGDPGLHYYARRQDSSGVLSYNQYIYNGGNWNFDNGVDVYRGTGIYRGEAATDNFAISQASHTSC